MTINLDKNGYKFGIDSLKNLQNGTTCCRIVYSLVIHPAITTLLLDKQYFLK